MKRGQTVIVLLVVIVAAAVALFLLFRGSVTGQIGMPYQIVPVQEHVTVPEAPIESLPNAGTHQLPTRIVLPEAKKKPKTVAENCIIQYIPDNDKCLKSCDVKKEECQKDPMQECQWGYDNCKIQCLDYFAYAVKEICIKKGLGVPLE